MASDIEIFVKNKKLASFRVINWIGTYTRVEIAEMLDISRPTLNTRLKKNNWRMKELEAISKKMPF